MAENSKIEWCDHTFNPWIGCQKVSPGCDHCYAEALMDMRYGKVQWGPHGERKRTSAANWKNPSRWAWQAVANGTRPRVFCASLADWLDKKAPRGALGDLCEVIEDTPELDWLLLSKRPENYQKLVPAHWKDGPPENVWLGVTAEDGKHFLDRWSKLCKIKARVRFISYEPALGPIADTLGCLDRMFDHVPDWLICGGESGPKRRPMDIAWARNARFECQRQGIAFFMKQIDKVIPIPDDLMIREFPV